MRERGVQSRRGRGGPADPYKRPGPPVRSGPDLWQIVAIVAIIAATAGWTAAGILAFREPSQAGAATPTETFDPDSIEEESFAPEAEAHRAPELEALLPAELKGSALQVQSWDGSEVLTDDPWSTSLASFLTSADKVPADLRVAQAYDPNEAIDGSIGVYQVAGVAATPLRDALIAAWKGDYPELKVSEVTLDGKTVTKGDFGEDAPSSYIYVRDDLVFDIETADETVAIAALAALANPRAAATPVASASPAP